MQIILEFPDTFVRFFSREQIQRELLLNNSLMLVKQGKMSISKAAQMAGLDLYDFLRECKQNQIAAIDYGIQDVKEELDSFS